MSFDSLGLSPALLSAVHNKGYETPSPIQAQAIPAILKGRDVLAAAQTGTGKTAGFTLPLLQLLSERPSPAKGRKPVRALIMTPTRELAAQVEESVKTYGAQSSLRSAVVFGGVNINPQMNRLRTGVDILVATPGRLLDLHSQSAVNLSQVEILVLDEADRMLDMGFIHDIRKILKLLPERRQNLLFSATFSSEIRTFTKNILHNPVSIDVAPRNTTAETVMQQAYRMEKSGKPALLKHLIHTGRWEQVLVFTRTKHGADRLSKKLNAFKITAAAIHGNKSQNARTRALAEFKAGETRVLVATDIAARGLDIKQLPHVVNFELPNVPEDYVHRIGRTGRAGATGHAVSLVGDEEMKYLRGIERLLKQKMVMASLPDDFEMPVAQPAHGGGGQGSSGSAQQAKRRPHKKPRHAAGERTQKQKPATPAAESRKEGQDSRPKRRSRRRPSRNRNPDSTGDRG